MQKMVVCGSLPNGRAGVIFFFFYAPLSAASIHYILHGPYLFTKINYSGGPLFVVKEINNSSGGLVGCERIVKEKFEIILAGLARVED